MQQKTVSFSVLEGTTLRLNGAWILPHLVEIEKDISRYKAPIATFDLSALEGLDSAGAMLICQLQDKHPNAQLNHIPIDFAALLKVVDAAHTEHMPKLEHLNPVYARIVRLGKATLSLGEDTAAFLSFLGMITLALWRSTVMPWRLRFNAIVNHMEEVGLQALPIVGLLSFLIGVVISYQGAQQLQQFGADLYVINLLGISILREIGVLMTAIIIAGRSGSAFTAQLGTMQVNQEIDALHTLGLDPTELLVLPRVIALTLILPLLTFYANMMALAGGAMMCWLQLDIGLLPFVRQLQNAIGLWTLWVGLIKAPVFAFIIAVVGCYQGFRVKGSADSVGRLTTRSVVHSIFLVIVLDAVFSILFAWLKV